MKYIKFQIVIKLNWWLKREEEETHHGFEYFSLTKTNKLKILLKTGHGLSILFLEK